MGNPTLSPPTTGTFQANEAVNRKLTFPPVPEGTVVTTTDHTMWALLPLPWIPCTHANYNPAASCSAGQARYPLSACQAPVQPIVSYAGFSDWKATPSYAQWQALVARAPALSTGTNWMDWLIAQTKADPPESPTSPGFYNFLACGAAAWTSTFSPNSVDNSQYWVVLVGSDKYTTGEIQQTNNFNFPARTLASGEQYFWYN
jgi:hypothetical protein